MWGMTMNIEMPTEYWNVKKYQWLLKCKEMPKFVENVFVNICIDEENVIDNIYMS